ncbi:MAG: c-type cytochrome [Prolixibacteraceae bacterium]|nr:c-type cytochrome [Prolixibacteraceae bacterium]MBN2773923.1 c-type cytochrome [Prolixibacteraceae bacterium]
MKTKICFLFVLIIVSSCGRNTETQNTSRKDLKTGVELFIKYGCIVCHSLEGKDIYGPALNNIYLKNVNVIRKGEELTLVADRDYLKKAISDPRYEKVKEYTNKDMPETYFSEKEVDILVDYLISLSENSNE